MPRCNWASFWSFAEQVIAQPDVSDRTPSANPTKAAVAHFIR
jgi:hypothetical protein